MNRWVKRILIGLGVVAGVLLIALGALVGYGEAAFGRTYERDLYPIEADTSPEGVARGEYLVKHVVACSGCHAERLGGPLTGRVEEVAIGPMRMTLVFPNLTPDEETGLGSWSDAEIARAIREGLDREGRELYIMPSQQLRVLSNADVAAIVGYLRTLEPVRNPLPPLSANALAKPMLAMHLMVPGTVSEPITEAQVAPEPGTVEYGEYLVWLGLCRDCHGQTLQGNKLPTPDALYAPNLTSSGNPGGWTEEQFIQTLRFGRTPEGRLLDPEQMHWPLYGQMSDDDLGAILQYLQSLPAE